MWDGRRFGAGHPPGDPRGSTQLCGIAWHITARAASYARDLDLRAGAEHAVRVPGEAAGCPTSSLQRVGATHAIA